MDGGNDRFIGMAGDDTAYGGAGNDVFWGGAGHEKLYGDDGQDRLQGDTGNDWLWGGNDNDTLGGDGGNDQLYGGTGCDTFVFAVMHGKDQINDFDAVNSHTSSHDKLDFSQIPELHTFEAVMKASRQQGGDVLIFTDPNNYIRLTHVALSDLDASDFFF